VTERVSFFRKDAEIAGWALNMSRGGLRAIVEDAVELGGEYEVAIGDDVRRPGRVVWIQEEPDGAVVGVSFLDDAGGSAPPPPPDDPEEGSAGGA
jgi:hypothetical protein